MPNSLAGGQLVRRFSTSHRTSSCVRRAVVSGPVARMASARTPWSPAALACSRSFVSIDWPRPDVADRVERHRRLEVGAEGDRPRGWSADGIEVALGELRCRGVVELQQHLVDGTATARHAARSGDLRADGRNAEVGRRGRRCIVRPSPGHEPSSADVSFRPPVEADVRQRERTTSWRRSSPPATTGPTSPSATSRSARSSTVTGAHPHASGEHDDRTAPAGYREELDEMALVRCQRSQLSQRGSRRVEEVRPRSRAGGGRSARPANSG